MHLEDCIDLPDNIVRTVYTNFVPKVQDVQIFVRRVCVVYKAGTINAVHAGARVKKLLQLVSGGVYDEEGKFNTYIKNATI